MGIRPTSKFRNQPKDDLEWGRFVDQATATPAPGEVTDESFANRHGTSVIGRALGTDGKPADITMGDGQFLVNRSGTLTGSGLLLADLPSGAATDTEVAAADAVVTAAFQSADAAHVAALDPHPQYLTSTEGAAAYQAKAAVLLMFHTGTGSPESVLTATVGHVYLRSDGGANTTLYVKESGSGNTGWVGK